MDPIEKAISNEIESKKAEGWRILGSVSMGFINMRKINDYISIVPAKNNMGRCMIKFHFTSRLRGANQIRIYIHDKKETHRQTKADPETSRNPT